MAVLFVEYPKCSTCKRAKAWLDEHGVEYVDRDIVADNPTAEELAAWVARSGLPVRRFFNSSGMKYRELGLKAPRFYHMPLLLAADGRRLSKRDGDQSLENLQQRYTPEQLVGRMAYALGLQDTPAPRTPTELLNGFDWNKIPRQDIALPEGLF